MNYDCLPSEKVTAPLFPSMICANSSIIQEEFQNLLLIFNILSKCWSEYCFSWSWEEVKKREKFTDRRQDRQATCNKLSEKITLAIEDDQDYRKIIGFSQNFILTLNEFTPCTKQSIMKRHHL